ncbi:MAG: hypothetical protein GY841_07240 [FCB group bacterium]|nr:hypothetical protein [FCB group bacterium]
MLNETVQKILKDYNVKKGYGISPEDLTETLFDLGKTVHKGEYDEHRWYTIFLHVKDFNGCLIGFEDMKSNTENACLADMDLEVDVSTAVEYKAVEELTVVYKPVG